MCASRRLKSADTPKWIVASPPRSLSRRAVTQLSHARAAVEPVRPVTLLSHAMCVGQPEKASPSPVALFSSVRLFGLFMDGSVFDDVYPAPLIRATTSLVESDLERAAEPWTVMEAEASARHYMRPPVNNDAYPARASSPARDKADNDAVQMLVRELKCVKRNEAVLAGWRHL